MKALDWAETSGNFVTIDICPSIYLASEVLNPKSALIYREVKLALKAIAWTKVREVWREEARGRSKLGMIGRLMDYECKARCVEVDSKR